MKKNVQLHTILVVLGFTALIGVSFKALVPVKVLKPIAVSKKALNPVNSVRADFNFDNIEFATNSANLKSSAYAELDKISSKLKDTKASLKVSGYADSKGPYVYNWKLSEKRAVAVKAYLINKGADSTKIATTEYGETKPIASNETAEGRQKNRRVQFEGF